MLILTRRIGESIVIGNEVYCTILGFFDDEQIKLGFDAPKSFPIHRYEIQRLIRQKIKQGLVEESIDLDDVVIDKLIAQQIKTQNVFPH
ncbi:TPA: carbon storage regulator [Legionella pneumophila]